MLRRLLHWLFDRHTDRSWGTLTTGPLDEEPPPIRNWGDGIAKVRELHPDRPRPMDKPRQAPEQDRASSASDIRHMPDPYQRDVGGMDWGEDE